MHMMLRSKGLETFTSRHPLVGPVFWIASSQFFIVQFIVAASWEKTYSWSVNTISDLGNTVCGVYGPNYVCSPLYQLMNISFVVVGCTMFIGSVLIYQNFTKRPGSIWAFGFMALSGIGTALVGLFPENTSVAMHTLGAALPFVFGNIALLLFARTLDMPRWLRIYTFLSGVITLTALVFFVSHQYMGIGQGGMERLVAHPQTLWLIVFGLYMVLNGSHAFPADDSLEKSNN